MSLINTFFGIPLGYLFYFCIRLSNDYGLSILLFTFLTKVLVFPLSLASQKNSVKMVRLQPLLEDAKERYSDNPSLHMRELKKLYKREKYNPFIGVLPLLVQIPVILGVINVMYNPLQHVFHFKNNVIAGLTAGIPSGFGAQLKAIESVKNNPEAFASAGQPYIQTILDFNPSFLGVNLLEIPSVDSPLLLVAVLSGLSAFFMCVLQNRFNVLQQNQGIIGKWGLTVFLVAFSAYFAFVVPAAIGIYWTAGNLMTIAVLFICNGIYDPKKYIEYKSNPIKKAAITKEEKAAARQYKKEAKTREKEDTARFYKEEKQLVFYSESSGFYKYFKAIIEYILSHSEITVHYITSDLRDQVFSIAHPRFKPYYVAGNALIAFMMRMDADMVVMTLPDLDRFHIKRSLVRKDIEYIYTDHGMGSMHLTGHMDCLSHFDTIFCNGPNQITEARAMEQIYNQKPKKLIAAGYSLLDQLLKNMEERKVTSNEGKKILIAPSWQKDNILELCLDETISPLLGLGYQIILRPHPEFIKRFPGKMKNIAALYGGRQEEGLILETDFSSNETVYTADLVITDWSTIAQEFSYATKRPSVFINTPMKIMNPDYQKIPLVPLEISLRDEIGVSVDVGGLQQLPSLIHDLFERKEEYKIKISQTVEKNIFNIGSCARVSGDYIINTLREKKQSIV